MCVKFLSQRERKTIVRASDVDRHRSNGITDKSLIIYHGSRFKYSLHRHEEGTPVDTHQSFLTRRFFILNRIHSRATTDKRKSDNVALIAFVFVNNDGSSKLIARQSIYSFVNVLECLDGRSKVSERCKTTFT